MACHSLFFALSQDGVRWKDLLAILLGLARWAPQGNLKTIQADKQRNVVKLAPNDLVLSRALARQCSRLQEGLHHCVHSYRKGRDQMTALQELQRYLRSYRRRTAVIERNLYVLRIDVKQCGESIYVGEDSCLWKNFSALGASDREIAWLKAALRPEIADKQGHHYCMYYGTPTGSPLQPLALNAYLSELDRVITQKIGKGKYLRFGDDVILLHPDYSHFMGLVELLNDTLKQLRLVANESKRQLVQFNGAARVVRQGICAKDKIEYLGMSVFFRGGIALNDVKTKKWLQDFARVCRFVRTLPVRQRWSVLRTSCKSFFSHDPYLAHHLYMTIKSKVDDRPWAKDVGHKMQDELLLCLQQKKQGAFIWKKLGLPFLGRWS